MTADTSYPVRTANVHMIAAMLEIALADKPLMTKDFLAHMDSNKPFDARRLSDALAPAQLDMLYDKTIMLTLEDNRCIDSRPSDNRMIEAIQLAYYLYHDQLNRPF